jgi:hypothetical protein
MVPLKNFMDASLMISPVFILHLLEPQLPGASPGTSDVNANELT